NRFNLWLGLFVFAGNYFFTRYFEEVLGLHYAFGLKLNLGAIEVGRRHEQIPFFLYLLTQAYFLTYHTVMIVLWRKLKRSWLALVPLACLVAFAETASMASPVMKGYYWYDDMKRMLTVGTLMYGSVFLISVPLLIRVDSKWSFRRVALDALAACMIQFFVF